MGWGRSMEMLQRGVSVVLSIDQGLLDMYQPLNCPSKSTQKGFKASQINIEMWGHTNAHSHPLHPHTDSISLPPTSINNIVGCQWQLQQEMMLLNALHTPVVLC